MNSASLPDPSPFLWLVQSWWRCLHNLSNACSWLLLVSFHMLDTYSTT